MIINLIEIFLQLIYMYVIKINIYLQVIEFNMKKLSFYIYVCYSEFNYFIEVIRCVYMRKNFINQRFKLYIMYIE